MPLIAALLAMALAVAATPFHYPFPQLNCREITIPVNVSAENENLASNSTTPPSTLVTGEYYIRARYCEPAKIVGYRKDTLQLLVHGITYTQNYWSGLAPPGTIPGQDEYSWIKYASDRGYPTLSVDRLCNGLSSRPDGLEKCQLPLEVATMHAIVQAAREGTLPFVGRCFEKIVYVGHSYGSLVANGLAVQHPKDADAYVLSGFSLKVVQGGAPVSTLAKLSTASSALPFRFGFLHEDPNYVVATSQQGVAELFYYGDYDPAVLQFDYDTRGTVTNGESETTPLGQYTAPEYTGAVFVLNGNEDGIFCEQHPAAEGTAGSANCSNGFSSGVHDAYPKARCFDYYNTPNTGHCLNTHRTAQQSFKVTHDWLAREGF
ncbi:hypothetical protein DOTSEDRAFT_72924 [Dothistroma septosporum NZE10]|uniref:AB hydrolase-1 domain-containing protein n=1 Tax=Dothistroma septosporum (strain NZE10 / CBS 128990) TaxID=675120 RepID=N1PKY0_DOTSN|nr:hypothetical protein DOTSEDRAFT_72924 [Dothistroma septosporum NZE10]